MPFIIGLTGSLGSGKTTVAGMFKGHGARIIDADAITRRLLAPNGKCVKKVAKAFGHVILKAGAVDRQQLAKIVFKNPRTLKKLTNVLYPEALKEVHNQIKARRGAPLIVLDVPLLFEAGWDRLADTTIVVRATQTQQIQRIQKRMGISKADILRRFKVQMPLREKMQRADIIVDNRASLTHTRAQVGAIMDRLNKRIRKTEK